uniref:membrane-associated phosphatidylinositol transfer protein 2-like isoform X3 n=1 Tax=Panthera onca TaxID=9690 RepID=UPI0029542E52|nr:membrane-associated phosphatidylinositol transfer protein 2-like isoform X3 [Panthera onca]
MVRAHRQAWCWQDEWYGLNMENIRELEKEAQLMLSRKMARFNEDDEEAVQLAKDEAIQAQVAGEPAQPSSSSSSSGEPLAGRGLKKQWSTSSKSSRSSKRGAPRSPICLLCCRGTEGARSRKDPGQRHRSRPSQPFPPQHLRVEDAEHRPGLGRRLGR